MRELEKKCASLIESILNRQTPQEHGLSVSCFEAFLLSIADCKVSSIFPKCLTWVVTTSFYIRC